MYLIKYSKNSNVMKYYNLKSLFSIIIYSKIYFIPVIEKPLLQSSVSSDPSEIILICRFGSQETFLIIFNVENCLTYL